MIVHFMDDPKFDQKCKTRGFDPEVLRHSMNVKGHSVKRDVGDKL